MSSRQKFTTWGFHGAVMAAVMSVCAGITATLSPGENMGPEGSLSWFLIESFDAIAEAGLLAALVGIHVRQAHRSGLLGRVGFTLTVAGTALFIVSTVMWLLPMNDGILLDILFNGALLGWVVGFPILGVATLRAGVLPRWCGVVLLAFIPFFVGVFMAVDYFGEVRALLAVAWLAFGAMLRVERRVAAAQDEFPIAAPDRGERV